MKRILNIVQDYLRKNPSPTQITLFDQIFKLNYTYSSPFTDSKHSREVLYPISNILSGQTLKSSVSKIIYNEKGRIQESDSFNSILVKEKHQKVLQDDVFGKAAISKDNNRWVYIAEIKQQVTKSYFNQGKGKQPYKYDFGETYDDIKQVGIFMWDKTLKQVLRVDLDKNIIPSCPSFANEEGTQIIFHAYTKQNFGHGILHCFNRPVAIYQAITKFVTKAPEQPKQGEKAKQAQIKLQAQVKLLIKDSNQTNIFPAISPCFNYLVYHSGTGITHTYYLDLVIAKRIEGTWTETHRIKEHFVGYYDTLKNYIVKEENKTYAYSQTIQGCSSQIYKIQLQTGEMINLTKQFKNHDFSISDVGSSGIITGVVTTNNFNTFYYINGGQIKLLNPLHSQNFIQKQYHSPIHALYIQAKEEDILEEFKSRINKRPLLVVPHGGPHGSFANMLTALRYTLLKMGYGLLMPNFSGSVGYGKERLEGSLQKIGEKDAQQIIQILQQVLSDNPSIDRQNVHIQGGSYGGYMSAIMGSRYPTYFKSAVILNGVLNIIANLWFTDIPEWNTVQALGKSQLSNLELKHYEEMFKQSPISQPMKIPTLQFLGAKDRRVPYKQGLFFDAITKDIGTPITTYVYENSAHSLADSVQTTIDILIKTVMFLENIENEDEKEEEKVKLGKE